MFCCSVVVNDSTFDSLFALVDKESSESRVTQSCVTQSSRSISKDVAVGLLVRELSEMLLLLLSNDCDCALPSRTLLE